MSRAAQTDRPFLTPHETEEPSASYDIGGTPGPGMCDQPDDETEPEPKPKPAQNFEPFPFRKVTK